ncbi:MULTISPECIES: hypothetical protein [Nocardiopsidaceae]|uniref:Uncharacterized protein n=1 Tax=Streptomonospora nanhaiensis TaxID=1323731 RepID=A0ABY6YL64_9ACTN|nr:hypothetical protein [Streptomonospora nanhaiensis]WAE72936.1 hypothetical protein OUQ99_27835 [Streptomonospora nanhaiensis]
MTALAALALTVLVLLAVSGAVTQLAKARKALRSRRRKAARRMRIALGPQTVARTRRKTARKGNRR